MEALRDRGSLFRDPLGLPGPPRRKPVVFRAMVLCAARRVSVILCLEMRPAVREFLYKERRWWLPLRSIGWAYAYSVIVFAFLVCVLLTQILIYDVFSLW